MNRPERPSRPDPRPRVVLVGSYRDPLGFDGAGLIDALAGRVVVCHVDAASLLRDGPRALLQSSAAIADEQFEMVHVLDARFAPLGALLRRRHRVPVSVSVTAGDVGRQHPWARLALRSLAHFDHAFAADEAVTQALRARAWRLPTSIVAPVARELPWPRKRDVTRVARALRGVRPGRLVLGVPWSEHRGDFRWFRDIVQPELEAKPVCLLFGVSSRREARAMLAAAGVQSEYRILSGRVDASAIAAVARAVDAFAVPAPSRRDRADSTAGLSLALAVSGAPIVSDGWAAAPVLAHEHNALLAEPGDGRGFAAALNQLLALPAVQRHFLGEEFARFTLRHWPWEAAAEVYADRFAALVGRPQIPADLRAA